MRIKSKLLIISVLPIIILLISSSFQYVASKQMEEASRKALLSDELSKMFSDLIILTHEHYAYNEERTHEQWLATHSTITNRFKEYRRHLGTPDNSGYEQIGKHIDTIGYLFSQYGPHDGNDSRTLRNAAWKRFSDRLTNRILQEMQTVAPMLALMHEHYHEKARNHSRFHEFMEISVLLVITLFIPLSAWMVYRAFSSPLEKLRQGINIIAKGDMDHRIGIPPKDELGELAVSFDRMADQRREAFENLKKLNEELEQKVEERTRELDLLAHYDSLTGLTNRPLFFDRLERAALEASRDGSSFALLFIDLDGFKQVNDSMGHDAGDRLLKEHAHRMSACVRASDTVARVGGDEFAVIIRATSGENDPALVADKILKSLSEPCIINGTAHSVSASIGIARFPVDATEPEHLFKASDIAMYDAKHKGRNRWCMFSGTIR